MKILKKIIFYFLILSSLAYLVRFILHEGIRKNKSGLFDKFNQVFHSNDFHEVIFVGSSRAECHFNPAIFDSITGLNSYNIGVSGSNNSFTYGILKSYLNAREAPKIAIMNIDYHFSNESSDTIYEFPRFFPYLDNEILFDELAKRDKRFYIFKYVPFYSLPFLGEKYLNCAMRGYTNKPSSYDLSCYKGFQYINPIEYKTIDKKDTVSYSAGLLKENADYLDSIITICKAKKIELYFIVSPAHTIVSSRIKNLDEHLNKFKAIATKSAIPFFDYTNDTICKQDDLFADLYHMKKSGADLFTTKFSMDFNAYMYKK